MAVATQSVTELCRAAKAAAREPGSARLGDQGRALLAVADAPRGAAPRRSWTPTRSIFEAGREAGLTDALMDRLALDAGRIASIAAVYARSSRCRTPSGRLSTRRASPTACR
jgi:glutamate-5-semialdehyde dehydrogenase